MQQTHTGVCYMNIHIEEHYPAPAYQTQGLPPGSCSIKAELNYLLCFETPAPAGAWDGAAARARGLVGDHALQEKKAWECCKLCAQVKGSWK